MPRFAGCLLDSKQEQWSDQSFLNVCPLGLGLLLFSPISSPTLLVIFQKNESLFQTQLEILHLCSNFITGSWGNVQEDTFLRGAGREASLSYC